jgi:hypothetical protein
VALCARRAVLISGEPGIGKTRLVSEMAAVAHGRGMLVLAGRCDEGLGLPYQPFAEAIEHLAMYGDPALLEAHLRDHGDAVARISPALRRHSRAHEGPARATTDIDRYVMFAAIEDLLAACAVETPVVLVLEDLHWADVHTIMLLRRLITSPASAALLVIGTTRMDELGDEHPLSVLLADAHREPGVERIELAGLEDEAVAELVELIGELDASADRLAPRLRESTAGNPFFITELIKSLSESGELDAAGRCGDLEDSIERSGGIPVSINDTVMRRVRRLGDATIRCLTAAAVIGPDFDLELLLGVAETEGVAVSLDRAVAAGLIAETRRDGAGFQFVHDVIRRCLYSELGPARRADLHRNVALALERRISSGRVGAAELARHWLVAGTPADGDRPLRYAVLAGEEAMAKLAPDDARRWFGLALEQLEGQLDADPGERCRLLIQRGEAERQSGDGSFRDTFLSASALARERGDADALVRAALANSRGLQSATGLVDSERIEVLRAALEVVGDADSPERARLLAILSAELTAEDRTETAALSDAALAMARRICDPETLAAVLNLRYVSIWTYDTHAERLANSREALEACSQLNDPAATALAQHWRAMACLEGDDVTAARAVVGEARELAQRLRQSTLQWFITGDEADIALIDGRLADAERLAASALQIGMSSEPDALPCYTAQLCAILFERGTLAPLVPAVQQAVADNPGIPGFRSTLALALCDAEMPLEAARVLEGELADVFGSLFVDATWLSVMCIYAHVAAELDHHDAAAAIYPMIAPAAGLIAHPGWGVWGPVDLQLGRLALTLGELDRAQAHLAAAADTAARACAPIWAARTRLARARLARARGDAESCNLELRRALAVAAELGCAGLARVAESLLVDSAPRE